VNRSGFQHSIRLVVNLLDAIRIRSGVTDRSSTAFGASRPNPHDDAMKRTSAR